MFNGEGGHSTARPNRITAKLAYTRTRGARTTKGVINVKRTTIKTKMSYAGNHRRTSARERRGQSLKNLRKRTTRAITEEPPQESNAGNHRRTSARGDSTWLSVVRRRPKAGRIRRRPPLRMWGRLTHTKTVHTVHQTTLPKPSRGRGRSIKTA